MVRSRQCFIAVLYAICRMQLSVSVEKRNAFVSYSQMTYHLKQSLKKSKQLELNRQQISVHLVTHLVPARDTNSCSPHRPVASLYKWAFYAKKWQCDLR